MLPLYEKGDSGTSRWQLKNSISLARDCEAARCPLLALSGHRLVRCTCLLFTQSGRYGFLTDERCRVCRCVRRPIQYRLGGSPTEPRIEPITVSKLWRRRAIGRRNDDLGAQARSASFRGGGRNCSVAKCRSSDGSKTRYRRSNAAARSFGGVQSGCRWVAGAGHD